MDQLLDKNGKSSESLFPAKMDNLLRVIYQFISLERKWVIFWEFISLEQKWTIFLELFINLFPEIKNK